VIPLKFYLKYVQLFSKGRKVKGGGNPEISKTFVAKFFEDRKKKI
jgi:hypothetical protein